MNQVINTTKGFYRSAVTYRGIVWFQEVLELVTRHLNGQRSAKDNERWRRVACPLRGNQLTTSDSSADCACAVTDWQQWLSPADMAQCEGRVVTTLSSVFEMLLHLNPKDPRNEV